MLVLSRKENESIVINENITIVVTGIQGSRVRIGIEAPHDVSVLRQEIAAKPSLVSTRQRVVDDSPPSQ